MAAKPPADSGHTVWAVRNTFIDGEVQIQDTDARRCNRSTSEPTLHRSARMITPSDPDFVIGPCSVPPDDSQAKFDSSYDAETASGTSTPMARDAASTCGSAYSNDEGESEHQSRAGSKGSETSDDGCATAKAPQWPSC
eukprot:gb/GFBE01025010.1/.p1 GENE.gb/GFBE01025010.1/~~gb/GFBE01025010.1/.p1  ORF type:complete len:139 (+),score=18.88 gb/GFBE01025010.1/:1-417(+)